jgi:hypothetical protein
MGEINGVFIFNGKPRNGATAKLWQSAGLGSPPSMDDSEPDGGYQQGSSITTGLDYGCDGAFRFESVPAGDYYVSVEYDGKRAWIYAGEININSVMTTQGDMIRRGNSVIERVAAGSEGAMFHISSGLPAWTA